jgi:Protein of unknown function (DUF3365)
MRLIIALMFLIQAQVRAVPEDLPTPPEALARARLLHSAFDGALRVMHRDFFRKGDSKAIPSESLKDVFKAMEESHGVTIRWLATAATAMNVENKAKDDFESEALKTITKGGKEVSKISQGTLRYVGSISLQNQCLKCHASDRTSLEDRFAALEISLPVRPIAAPPAP